ncbi:MAG: hypothetical protein GQ527_09135 [Bacteroidales bacterium]|nr:hypothetical protein [Bacteroidales bacterium]
MNKLLIIVVAVLFSIIGCEKEKAEIVEETPVAFTLEQVTYQMDMDAAGYFDIYEGASWGRYNDESKPLEVELEWPSPSIEPVVKFTVLADKAYVEIMILGNDGTKVLAELRDEYPRGTYELLVD